MDENVTLKPTPGVVEPEFLEYMDRTFKRWQKLYTHGVAVGTREIAKLSNIVHGASMNAKSGFIATADREEIGGTEHFTMKIYSKDMDAESRPLYTFETPIYK